MTLLKEDLEELKIVAASEAPAATTELPEMTDELPEAEKCGLDEQAKANLLESSDSNDESVEGEHGKSIASRKFGHFFVVAMGIAGMTIGMGIGRLTVFICQRSHAIEWVKDIFHQTQAENFLILLIQIMSPIAGCVLAIWIASGFTKASFDATHSFRQLLASEFDRHKLPLLVLLSMALVPKLVLLWIPLALVWTAVESLYKKMPPLQQQRLHQILPEHVRQSPLLAELSDGIAQARPFIIFPLYIFCIPIALVWMTFHWFKNVAGMNKEEAALPLQTDPEQLSFIQNRRNEDEESESNFFHSPAFAITSVALFGCGLPAFLTYALYQHMGIDALIGFPSANPQFGKVFVTIDLYIYSLAWCISVLFIRSWFTFPLNFVGDESRIQIDKQGVRRRLSCWFTQVLTLNSPWAGCDTLTWQEIKCIRVAQHCTRLYPLPTTALDENAILYKILNRLALFIDGISARENFEEFLLFRTESYGGNEIKIRLAELNGDERARLFYAIRKWAPDVAIDQTVQEKMIGSTVMQAPRYTQMWFELLTENLQRKRTGALAAGEKLQNGQLEIVNRLASGGQANVYLARKADRREVVLKEFILSNSDAVGSLIESAGEFETESTLLSQLSHPRIVEMMEFFAEDRRLYLVLEKVPGESLRKRVKSSGCPLSELETVELSLQLCEVLSYLHGLEPPVVHRDIAPDNIMFDEEKGIKLLDFSLAAAKKAHRTTSTMGKHCYAPPEQFREQPCPQSDIYALGATMFFLLTGEDPKPITPSDLIARLPESSPHLAEIIKRATAFELADRYSEISWMMLELRSLHEELSIK